MAIFSTDLSNKLSSANDLQQIKSYLYKLNENLEYMFNNLTPEDNNASGVPKLTYVKDSETEASFEISVDGIKTKIINGDDIEAAIEVLEGQIALKVNTSDLGNSSLTIKPSKIELATTGQLIINAGNLKIDSSGNATFSGSLNAASGSFNGNLTSQRTYFGFLCGLNGVVEIAEDTMGSQYVGSISVMSEVAGNQTDIVGGTVSCAYLILDEEDIGSVLRAFDARISALEE